MKNTLFLMMSRSRKIANALYQSSPQELFKYANKYWIKNKNKEGLAAHLDKIYYARRDPFIQVMIEKIINGDSLIESLSGFNGKNYDERIVEYPYFVSWLLRQEEGLDLLDVGCVLNNKIVSNILKKKCRNIWFCNPSIEDTSSIQNLVYYHVADLQTAFSNGENFPLLTCLSTIEHIGYDNSQYGNKIPGKYTTPSIEPFINSLHILARLLKNGGNMLISFPFGFREAVIHPATNKIASQVFDYDALQEGLNILASKNIKCKYEVFAASENGWGIVNAKNFHARYAHGCPAACAVAFISGRKGNC